MVLYFLRKGNVDLTNPIKTKKSFHSLLASYIGTVGHCFLPIIVSMYAHITLSIQNSESVSILDWSYNNADSQKGAISQ